jgi:hypothetical protein
MNDRRINVRHFRSRMIGHIMTEAHGGLARPLWVIAREYISDGINPSDATRIMRGLGMGRKSIRAAIS